MNLAGTVHINKTGCCILLALVLIFFYYIFSSSRNPDPRTNFNEVNLRELLAAAIEAAKEGGREVVATRNNLKIESKGKTKEGANDSVTTADFKSHCAMLRKLQHSFPSVEVVSEESNTVCDENKPSDVNDSKSVSLNLKDEWVSINDVKVWIDPLDATQEYTEKLYQYVTTMVCVAVHGKPVIGVIHKPFSKETTWAWVGEANSPNLNAPTSNEDHKDQITFIVSRSHTGKAKDIIEERFADKKVEIISAGGAGYKVLEVAKRRADVYYHVTAIKKWDICAGNAVLNRIGGRMTTRHDKEIDYADSVNSVNEDGLVATMKDHNLYLSSS